MPLLSGLSTGVKHVTRLRATAISSVRWAAKIDPLSDSHCTGCGARIAPKRCSTERTIMSRIISPEMPAVVATQEIASRSMAIEREGDAHELATPAGELQRIRVPAAVRADRRHLAVVLAYPPASRMTFEQEAMLLHQPID